MTPPRAMAIQSVEMSAVMAGMGVATVGNGQCVRVRKLTYGAPEAFVQPANPDGTGAEGVASTTSFLQILNLTTASVLTN